MDLGDLYIDILMWLWIHRRIDGYYQGSKPQFLENIDPWVKPVSPANPESHQGVQNVLIESVLWLSTHSHAVLSPTDLTRPRYGWLVGDLVWLAFIQCTLPI